MADEETPGETGADGTDGTTESGHGAPSSTFKFNFAGIPLLVPTPSVEKFINRYLPLRSYFRQPPTPAGGWASTPDQQWPLTPELNVLYWPTGCTRWGFGVFLFSGEWLDAMMDKLTISGGLITLPNGGTSFNYGEGMEYLELGNPNDPDHYIRAKMRPLMPVPVTGNSEDGSIADGWPLYLLPLVDHRYGEQFGNSQLGALQGHIGATFPSNSALNGWSSSFAGAVTYNGFIQSQPAQPLPDYAEFVDEASVITQLPSNCISLTQIAESTAWSLGLTFILETDGSSAHFLHGSVGNEAGLTNGSQVNSLIEKVDDFTFVLTAGFVAGAEKQASIMPLFQPSIPNSIIFSIAGSSLDTFDGNSTFSAAALHQITFTAESLIGVKGGAQALSVVAPIIIEEDRDENGAGQGTVDGDLARATELFRTIALEWYTQMAIQIDATFADICKIPLSAHTDIVEWTFNRRGPQTRVRSRRPNAFPTRLINQFKNSAQQQRLPRRFEIVAVKSDSQVTWDGRDFAAVYPIKTDGFNDFDQGQQVIAGFEPIAKKFFVCNNRPLDFDFIADHLADEYGFERGEGLDNE